MIIRKEIDIDIPSVFAINKSAFETTDEAKLVDILRENVSPLVSLVALVDNKIVGHIMFSPVTLSDYQDIKIMGLAPMAVAPAYQKKGIGSALIKQGFIECKKLGYEAVVVLGHADYYPRFGFVPSVKFGFASEYKVDDKYFMALELQPDVLCEKSGIIKYHKVFGSL